MNPWLCSRFSNVNLHGENENKIVVVVAVNMEFILRVGVRPLPGPCIIIEERKGKSLDGRSLTELLNLRRLYEIIYNKSKIFL